MQYNIKNIINQITFLRHKTRKYLNYTMVFLNIFK